MVVHTSGYPRGAFGYFLGGYVPPGTPIWHAVLKKIFPKIDTQFLKWANFPEIVRRMWSSTFVPETIFRRSFSLNQTDRKCWTIGSHSDERTRLSKTSNFSWTYNSLSLVGLMKSLTFGLGLSCIHCTRLLFQNCLNDWVSVRHASFVAILLYSILS